MLENKEEKDLVVTIREEKREREARPELQYELLAKARRKRDIQEP